MEWKYAIVREWASGDVNNEVVSAAVLKKLSAYLKEGRFYRDNQPQVATEQG